MRTFKLLNSVKKTDNQVKVDRLKAQGYEEITEKEENKQEEVKEDKEPKKEPKKASKKDDNKKGE